MKMKKLTVLFTTIVLTTVAVTGYSGGQKETAAEITKETEAATIAEVTTAAEAEATEMTEEVAEAVTEADEENYDTGDASKDNTRNQDEIDENEFLVISFGTSYNDDGRLTIGTIEDVIGKTFPDFAVRRGFTSRIITDHMKSRDDVAIDNMNGALDRAGKDGVENLMIQPTRLTGGPEYAGLVNKVTKYSDAFEKVAIGKLLLTISDDFKVAMKAITEAVARYNDGETAICFMGHDTEVDSNQIYVKMQDMFTETGYRNYYVDTVEAVPGLDDILTAVKEEGYREVVLGPLMIVAGDHVNSDMAGDGEDSWKAAFEDTGYEVTCFVNGLGELEATKQPSVEHAQAAVDSLAK